MNCHAEANRPTAPELALVAVDLAAEGTDRIYTYLVPAALSGHLQPGGWVQVPFGARRLIGCYLGPSTQPPPGVQLRPLFAVVADIPPLPQGLLDLARWIADRYVCTFAAALRLLLPAAARRQQVRERKVTAWRTPLDAAGVAGALADLERKAPLQARLLRELSAAAVPVPAPALATRCGSGAGDALKALARRGWADCLEQSVRRNPFAEPAQPDQAPALTALQAEAVARITAAMDRPGQSPTPPVWLLHGITGSGKTEVYLRVIGHTLAQGRQAIVLVPEISLTPQTVARFRARFGDRVAVLHSALSDGERWDEWVRIRRGDVAIAIGARSAIFAPFEHPGVVILDEEHEGTYKQDEAPRYHAREVAEERAARAGATLVLGSATPALETFYRAEVVGDIQRIDLPERIDSRPLPTVQQVDMRQELSSGNRSIFSRLLQEQLRQCLSAGEQSLLFLNRRGFHTFVLCRSCGDAVQCPHCAISLTYHSNAGSERLECHWCGHAATVPKVCPACGSKAIRFLGTGTERVEVELKALLPSSRVLRLDVDTTRRKGAHAAILGAFGRGEADILVGTQMIAKGLDYPRVTLVGVILADVTLNLPDFRAAERTFQLMTQVAGRAGRGDLPGRAVVQTYVPNHVSLAAASRHDYRRFYDHEIQLRAALSYPPFSHFVRLMLTGPEEPAVQAAAARLRAVLDTLPDLGAEVVGPCPAPLARLRGQWRYHLLLKGPRREGIVAALRRGLGQGATKAIRSQGVRLGIDVGPLNIL